MKTNILAFGVHPDDVELGCSGVLLVEKQKGSTIGIVDLTRGELGTRGTAEIRDAEAADAAKILGADVRVNLAMADGFFQNDEMHQRQVITEIRKFRPEIILCNAPEDRHPDHGRSAALVSDAAFLSGLMKVETRFEDQIQQPWRPKYVFHYIQDRYLEPDFVIDISAVFEQKLESIRAYKTQFFTEGSDGPETYISTPDFLDSIVYRAKMFGKMIGVKYAEGLISKKKLGLNDFHGLVLKNT